MRKSSSPIGPDTPWLTVVGVVRDAQLRGPLVTDYGTNGTFYLPYAVTAPTRLRLRHPDGRRSRRLSFATSDRRSRSSIARSRSSTSGRCPSGRSWHCMSRTSTMQLAIALCGGRRVPVRDRPVRSAGLSGHAAVARDRRPAGVGSAPRAIVGLILRRRTRPGDRWRRAWRHRLVDARAAGRFAALRNHAVEPLGHGAMTVTLEPSWRRSPASSRRAALHSVDVMRILSAP